MRTGVRQVAGAYGDGERAQAPLQVQASDDELRGRRVDEVIAQFDALVGLAPVKRLVREVRAVSEVRRLRLREHLANQPMSLHMAFSGNPGTGKTTVARLLGRLLKELEVLPKGHVVEASRADLVGEYIGHTAHRVREHVRKALGGVLFIDEAYALARGGDKDFGREAIDTLVKEMEDHRDDLVLVFAGYPAEMSALVRANPGLMSRFALHIAFPDYSVDELARIADLMFDERQYRADIRARTRLMATVSQHLLEADVPGNARLVRNMVEHALRQHALRVSAMAAPTRDQLMLIRAEDLRGF